MAFNWLRGIFGGSGDGEPVEGGAFRESGVSDADVIAELEASLGSPSGGVDVSRLVVLMFRVWWGVSLGCLGMFCFCLSLLRVGLFWMVWCVLV